jgi:hypothetical protein
VSNEQGKAVGTEGGAVAARLSPAAAVWVAVPALVVPMLLNGITYSKESAYRSIALMSLGLSFSAAVAIGLAWPQARGCSRIVLGVVLVLIGCQSMAALERL